MITKNMHLKLVGLLFAMALVFTNAEAATTIELDNSRNSGIAWLLTQQNGDGSWGNTIREKIFATTAAIEALSNAGIKGYAYQYGISWLANAEAFSNDGLARQIITLHKSGVGVSEKVEKLIAQKNGVTNVEWGAYKGYSGSFPDTALAMEAITLSGATFADTENVLGFMFNVAQRPDGGWPYANSSLGTPPSEVIPTAYSIIYLNKSGYAVQAFIDSAIGWLRSVQSATDGRVGNGSVFETAVAYLAFAAELGSTDITAFNAQDFIVSQQNINGSWNDDAFQTATALQTLPPVIMTDTDEDGVPDAIEDVLGTDSSIHDSRSALNSNGQSTAGVSEPIDGGTLTVGNSFNHTLTVAGGAAPYYWQVSSGSLPTGLLLNSNTGVISGTATTAGVYNFTYTVTDNNDLSGSALVQLIVLRPNVAPIINTLPATTATQDIAYAYDVDATDSDAEDILTYTLDIAPGGMTISGVSGLISWTPGGSDIGNHTVIVRVADSNANSVTQTFTLNVASSNETTILTNPLSNDSIVIDIDGNIGEWAGLERFPADATDVALSGDHLDLTQLWMAHDTSYMYLAYENETVIPDIWSVNFFLDTDQNPQTGYRGIYGELAIGVEYLLQGNALYRYVGDGASWAWSGVGSAELVQTGAVVEMALPIALIENAGNIDLVAMTSGGEDYYPNAANGGGAYFTYEMTVLGNPVISNTVSSMTVDGSLNEWAGLDRFPADAADVELSGDHMDLMQLWMAHDTSYLYLAYENETVIPDIWSVNFFLDTDQNPQTGYRGIYGELAIGVEYLLQGNALYRYVGDGASWAWSEVGSAELVQTGAVVEMALPIALIDNAGNLDLVAMTSGGEDYYPSTANSGGYFTYEMTVLGSPVISNTVSFMSVDGSLNEWAGLERFPADAADVELSGDHMDLMQLWMAHDTSYLYLAYENETVIPDIWSVNFFLDTDQNPLTGYRGISGELAIGVEYLLQGNALYRYVGDGVSWAWSEVGSAELVQNGATVEMALPIALIENAGNMNLVVMTSSGEDYYPNAANGGGAYFTYEMTVLGNPIISNTVSSMTVDGSLNEWAGLDRFPADAADVELSGDHMDLMQLWMAHDTSYLYLAYENETVIPDIWSVNFFLDTDQNPLTGYRGISGELAIGVEYLLQGNALYRYVGDGVSWAWSGVGSAELMQSGATVEIALPIALIENAGNIDLVAMTSGGEDYYPNAANSAGAYFTYTRE